MGKLQTEPSTVPTGTAKMDIPDGRSAAAFMTPANSEPNAWIEELARALSGLASAQDLYRDDIDRHRQQHIRSHAERSWSTVPLHPSDYLKSFYFHACRTKSRYLAQHYTPLRAAYTNVRAVLAAHPSWSDFVDPADDSGGFPIRTATSGGLGALSSIIGGLMARAMELGANRFSTAATELHDLLEPAREPKAPPARGDLSVGYHVVLLHGLSVSDDLQIAEAMALMPFEQMCDFVNETAVSDVAPNIIKFNAWKSVSAIVKPFHWKPAFGERGDDTLPTLDWGGSFFEDAQTFVELLAMFHAGPVVRLVTIPYCIHRTASYLFGLPYYHGSVEHGPMAHSFDSFARTGPVSSHALAEARKAFKDRATDRYKGYAPVIARLAEALARSGRFEADDKILDVAIALERMYELDRGEISFKLKTRAACFLEAGTEGRLRVFRDVGDFYEARSSIVHRRRKDVSTEAKLAAFQKGFEVARRSVVKLVEHGPPPGLERNGSPNPRRRRWKTSRATETTEPRTGN